MEKIDRIISKIRNLKEDGPTMSLSSGQIAGTPQSGDDPPVDFRKKKFKKFPMFYRNLLKKTKNK
jgi:hypothetical protein